MVCSFKHNGVQFLRIANKVKFTCARLFHYIKKSGSNCVFDTGSIKERNWDFLSHYGSKWKMSKSKLENKLAADVADLNGLSENLFLYLLIVFLVIGTYKPQWGE